MANNLFQDVLDRTEDLRGRLIRSFILIIVFAVLAYVFRERVLEFLQRPLTDKELIFIHPTEAFFTYIKLSLFVGVLLSVPYLLYQLIQILSPFLSRSKRFSRGFTLGLFGSGSLFFYAGAAFALLGVLPFALDFLKAISGESLNPTFTVGNYASFVMSFTLIFGLLFEMPVISFGLAKLNIIRRETLTSQWKFALVGAALVAAVLTPPDPITQMFLWGPLLILYGLSIVLAGIAQSD
ncbi:twin-arginine translocase subunit TatC [Candidatus Bipolaricaulota bacterium]|nr:twin-arginine translocase subunit TatC [Candidatus Bipolaricaulota bacterium]